MVVEEEVSSGRQGLDRDGPTKQRKAYLMVGVGHMGALAIQMTVVSLYENAIETKPFFQFLQIDTKFSKATLLVVIRELKLTPRTGTRCEALLFRPSSATEKSVRSSPSSMT